MDGWMNGGTLNLSGKIWVGAGVEGQELSVTRLLIVEEEEEDDPTKQKGWHAKRRGRRRCFGMEQSEYACP